MRSFPTIVVSCLLLNCCLTLTLAQGTSSLPVEKVVLFKNGIGYFQHLGRVTGGQVLEIPLSSSQLDDVLKSLTVIDLDGGRISTVSYDSAAPLDRQLDDLPIDPDGPAGLVGFLNQLRGSRVQVGQAGQGHLVSAELRTRSEGVGTASQTVEVGILTDAGALKTLDLQSEGGLTFSDPVLAEQLQKYLQILNRQNQQDVRRLQIQTSGTGERRVFVAYTAEAPIWKSTYRIVLDPGKEALLQGWALVDNTTQQPWQEVELSLVSGAPVSFIQNLSQPVYGRRPVVPLPEGIQVAPDIHEATFEEASDRRQEPGREAQLFQNQRGTGGIVGGAPGGVLGGVMAAEAASVPASPVDAMRESILVTAEGTARADQFEYAFPQRLSIGANRSALIPILQTDLEARKVSLYNPSYRAGKPRLAIWVRNSSQLTLDGGSFTVIDASTFAGEGLLETLQPDERRLLSYAVDLSTTVSTTRESEQQRVDRVIVNRGVLRFHRKLLETQTYSIRNSSKIERTVVVEHPVRQGWKLRGGQPEEVSTGYYRFQTQVASQANGKVVVQEEFPLENAVQVSSVTTDQLDIWVRQKEIPERLVRELRTILEQKAEVARLEQELRIRQEEEQRIFQDQQRIRENLGRLSRTPEETQLRQRYIQDLQDQEDRLAEVRGEQQDFRNQLRSAQGRLNQSIESLTLEEEA